MMKKSLEEQFPLWSLWTKLAIECGGEYRKQFLELVRLAQVGAKFEEMSGRSLRELLEPNNGTSSVVETVTPVAVTPASETDGGTTKGKKSSLEVQLEMLEIMAKDGESAVVKHYSRLAKAMGESPRNCAKWMGPLRARTHLGHRPIFLKRVCKEFGIDILNDLLPHYQKIDGAGITLTQLQKEYETGKVAD